MFKNILKDYLTFSKKERNAVFILLVLLAILIVLPSLIPAKKMHLRIDENYNSN